MNIITNNVALNDVAKQVESAKDTLIEGLRYELERCRAMLLHIAKNQTKFTVDKPLTDEEMNNLVIEWKWGEKNVFPIECELEVREPLEGIKYRSHEINELYDAIYRNKI